MCSRRMTGQHWHSVGLVWEATSSSLVQVYQWHHLLTASNLSWKIPLPLVVLAISTSNLNYSR